MSIRDSSYTDPTIRATQFIHSNLHAQQLNTKNLSTEEKTLLQKTSEVFDPILESAQNNALNHSSSKNHKFTNENGKKSDMKEQLEVNQGKFTVIRIPSQKKEDTDKTQSKEGVNESKELENENKETVNQDQKQVSTDKGIEDSEKEDADLLALFGDSGNAIQEGVLEKEEGVVEKEESAAEEEEGVVEKEESAAEEEEGVVEKEESVAEGEEGVDVRKESIADEQEGTAKEALFEERIAISAESKPAFAEKIALIEEEFKTEGGILPLGVSGGLLKQVAPADIASGKVKDIAFFKPKTGEILIPAHLKTIIKLIPGDRYEGVKIKKITVLNDEDYRAYVTAYVNYARKQGLLIPFQRPTPVTDDQQRPSSSREEHALSSEGRRDSLVRKVPLKPASESRDAKTQSVQTATPVELGAINLEEFKEKLAKDLAKINKYLADELIKAGYRLDDIQLNRINKDNLKDELAKFESLFDKMKKAKGIPLQGVKTLVLVFHKDVKEVLNKAKGLQLVENDIHFLKNLDETFTKVEAFLINIAGTNATVGNKDINAKTPYLRL